MSVQTFIKNSYCTVGIGIDKSLFRSFLSERRGNKAVVMAKEFRVPRRERLEMIRRLIEKDEVRCARLCCQSWNIAESVFRKFVREYGTDGQKELWLQ